MKNNLCGSCDIVAMAMTSLTRTSPSWQSGMFTSDKLSSHMTIFRRSVTMVTKTQEHHSTKSRPSENYDFLKLVQTLYILYQLFLNSYKYLKCNSTEINIQHHYLLY